MKNKKNNSKSLKLFYKNNPNKIGFQKGNQYGNRFKKGENKGVKPWNKGLTKETNKQTMRSSIRMKGENNPGWQGGIQFEPYSVDWTETLKKSIKERDKYLCQVCLNEGKVVHHIDYNKNNCNSDNLITLCRSCHAKTNKNKKKWVEYFNSKNARHV